MSHSSPISECKRDTVPTLPDTVFSLPLLAFVTQKVYGSECHKVLTSIKCFTSKTSSFHAPRMEATQDA